MELQPVDGSTLLFFMIAGAIIAVVGLYLMLRPKPEDSAKIEMFGLKFESSSAGLLVFAVGAVFLSLPLFVPEKTGSMAGTEQQVDKSETDAGTPSAPEGSSGDRNDVAVSNDAGRIEAEEPNDTINQAQVLAPGQWVSGKTGNRKIDWFKVPYAGVSQEQEVKVRRLSGSGIVTVSAFDARESLIDSVRVKDSTQYLKLSRDPGDTLYIRVDEDIGLSAEYELIVSPVAP